jgi:hypothetical protein
MSDSATDIRWGVQPAFVICVVVLIVAAAGMSVAQKQLGLYLKKEPLPLAKPLEQLDEAKLAPYVVVERLKIENDDILESLGTTDYIQWVLDDPSEAIDSPVRRVLLFVTYYGRPDRVPHVPEECYTGGGYQRLATGDVKFRLDRDIPGRYVVFGSTAVDTWPLDLKFPVLYLFNINGRYASSRDDARMALNKNIFSRYAYLSKVELVYNQGADASQASALAAAERLLALLLPLLEQEHWPQWERQ